MLTYVSFNFRYSGKSLLLFWRALDENILHTLYKYATSQLTVLTFIFFSNKCNIEFIYKFSFLKIFFHVWFFSCGECMFPLKDKIGCYSSWATPNHTRWTSWLMKYKTRSSITKRVMQHNNQTIYTYTTLYNESRQFPPKANHAYRTNIPNHRKKHSLINSTHRYCSVTFHKKGKKCKCHVHLPSYKYAIDTITTSSSIFWTTRTEMVDSVNPLSVEAKFHFILLH